MNFSLLLGIMLLFALSVPKDVLADAPIYVDATAQGANDGTSWTDAYTNLQSALDVVVDGDEVWVAAGVYTPTNGVNDDATFFLVNGVALYGGFAGNETNREARDWATHITVLSGDLEGDDTTDGNGVVLETQHIIENRDSRNADCVVTSSANDATTILDGFTITAGAYGNYGSGMRIQGGAPTLRNLTFQGNQGVRGVVYNSGNSHFDSVIFAYNDATNGGGMYNTGSPTLQNVLFSYNSGSYGGGFYTTGGSPLLQNVTFSHNEAYVYGGGLAHANGSAVLLNVTFSHNTANSSADGGGLYIGNGTPMLVNVTLSNNSTADGYGGGIYINNGSATMVNTVIHANHAPDDGGGVYSVSGSELTLINSNVTNNSATSNTADPEGGGLLVRGTVNLKNCYVANNTSGYYQVVHQDQITILGGNVTLDYTWIQGGCPAGAACAYVIGSGSGLDAGDNSVLPSDDYDLDGDGDILEPLPYDRDGNPRFAEHPHPDTGYGTAPLVDMGAYETSLFVLDKVATPAILEPGEALTYVITFENDSTYVITDVHLSDIVPTHVYSYAFSYSGVQITPTAGVSYTWEMQNLAPHESGVITITGLLSTSLLPGRDFANIATLSGLADGVVVERSTRAIISRFGADLAVTQSSDRDPIVAGERLTYTITITNLGLFDADILVLTDTFPHGSTFASASAGCGLVSSHTLTCSLDGLLNQASVAVTVAMTAPVTAGYVTNHVTVTSATPDPDLTNNAATAVTWSSAAADLVLTKFAHPSPVLAGDVLTYTLVISNVGPDAAGAVRLTDALPLGADKYADGVTYIGRQMTWHLNEAVGADRFVDESGFGRHGTCDQSADTCPASNVRGLYDYVVNFDGVDDWIQGADFDLANDFTLSLWVYPHSVASGQTFIAKNSAGGGDLLVFGYGDSGYALNIRGTTYQTGTKTIGEWQHLAVVGRQIDPTTTDVTVYRDGAVLWQHEFDTVLGDLMGKGWAVGQEWDGSTPSDFFLGAMDEISLYNRALSAADIAALSVSHPVVQPLVSQGVCDLDASLTCELGLMRPGASVVLTLPVRLNAAQSAPLTNTAWVSSYVPDSHPASNRTVITTIVGTDWAIAQRDIPDPVAPGEQIQYTITATRHAPADVVAHHFTATVANSTVISMPISPNEPAPALLYPSTITVADLLGTVLSATVTLHDVSHVWPDEMDMLLVAPNGQGMILLSDAGDYAYGFSDSTITFDDTAPDALPQTFGQQIFSGTYKPTDYTDADGTDVFPAPAPSGPYGAAFSVFEGSDPNGDWQLYVTDDVKDGGSGQLASGWSLSLWTGSSGIITDVLPTGTTFVSASPGCDESAGVVTCILDFLPDVTMTTVDIAATAPMTVGLMTNTVTIMGFQPDFNILNNIATETTLVSAVDLDVAKTAHTRTVLVGDALTYTVLVTNHGPLTATQVFISDTLPTGLTFVGYTATLGVYTATAGLWQVGTLAANQTATLNLATTVVVNPGVQTLTNTAQLSTSTPADVLENNNAASAVVTIASPNLVVTKTVDTGGVSEVTLGGIVTYSLAVSNIGTATATGVVLTDPLPSGVTFGTWLAQGLGDASQQTVTWGPHTVAVSEVYTFNFTANVTTTTGVAGDWITNTVVAVAANANSVTDSAGFMVVQSSHNIYLPLVIRE